jgi:hemolysin activation/secretion protein
MTARLMEIVTIVGVIASAAMGSASAQSVSAAVPGVAPPSSPIDRTLPPTQPEVAPPAQPPTGDESPIAAGPEIKVATIAIEGASVYPAAALDPLLDGIAGAVVHTGRIVEAVRKIQAKYRDDGYFLTVAKAVVTPGANGTVAVKVQITEGYISSVKIDGDVGPVAALVYDYLNHLSGLRPVRYADVERYALLAQNIPGLTLRTVLRPSKDEPGAAELIAQVTLKRLDFLVTDDNRGSRYAGPNQLLAGVTLNSMTSLGERTELLVYDTPFSDEQLFGQASMEAFLGSEGFKGRVYAGYGISEPGDALRQTGYKSRLLLAGASGTYPVIRSRDLSLFVSGAFDVEQSEIDLRGFDGEHHRTSNSHLRVLRLSSSLDYQDVWLGAAMAAADSATLTLSRGVPELGGDSNGAPDPARPNERNDFLKISTELVRVQNLYSWNSDLLALKLAFAGQWTSDILPPAEKFFLGGNQYGRGFYSGEVTGDRTAAGTIELQFNDPVETDIFGEHFNLGFQYYTFFDIGQAWDLAPGDPSHHLESVGVGLRLAVTDNVSFELEGDQRFTRRPNGGNLVSRETEQAGFFRLVARY